MLLTSRIKCTTQVLNLALKSDFPPTHFLSPTSTAVKLKTISRGNRGLVSAEQGGVVSPEIHLFMCQAATSVSSCVQSCMSVAMSLNTVGATISRSLRATGTTRTPSFARSHEIGRVCASRWVSTDGSEGRAAEEGRQSRGESATPGGPGSEVPASREPQTLKCPPGDKKKGKEQTRAPGVGGGKKRPFTSRALPADRKTRLWARYNEMKRLVHGKLTSCSMRHKLGALNECHRYVFWYWALRV